MIDITIGLACILLLTYVSVLEKIVMNKHNFMDIALSRLFYMLLILLVIIIIYNPRLLTSESFMKSMKDPQIMLIGGFTTIGALLYYFLLSSKNLYMMSLIWPLIMIFTIIAAYMFLKESLNKFQWLGIILTFIGASMTLYFK